MRELKFRVWDHSNNEFVDDMCLHVDGTLMCDCGKTGYVGDFTIQQFTGLKDKNEIEIYERDIISCDEYQMDGMKDRHHPACVIIWDGCSWTYSLDKERNFKNPHQILRYARNMKVIGNIFENPELIK